jgi:hypothetical protein
MPISISCLDRVLEQCYCAFVMYPQVSSRESKAIV